MPDFNNIANSFKGTFRNFFNPHKYVDLFEEGPKAAIKSVSDLLKSDIRKDPGNFVSNLGSAVFTAGLPLMDLAHAFNPNREDMDYAGPFEEIATRLSETGNALLFAHDPFMPHGGTLWGAIPAYMLAAPIINTGARYTGKAIDYLSGNVPPSRPKIQQKSNIQAEDTDAFADAVSNEAEKLRQLYPKSTHAEITRMAVGNTLRSAQEYMRNMRINF